MTRGNEDEVHGLRTPAIKTTSLCISSPRRLHAQLRQVQEHGSTNRCCHPPCPTTQIAHRSLWHDIEGAVSRLVYLAPLDLLEELILHAQYCQQIRETDAAFKAIASQCTEPQRKQNTMTMNRCGLLLPFPFECIIHRQLNLLFLKLKESQSGHRKFSRFVPLHVPRHFLSHHSPAASGGAVGSSLLLFPIRTMRRRFCCPGDVRWLGIVKVNVQGYVLAKLRLSKEWLVKEARKRR